MEVTQAFLADAVNVSADGKLNMLGVFQSILADGVPVLHTRMMLVFAVAFNRQDVIEKHVFQVILKTEDGRVVSKTNDESLALPWRPETDGLEYHVITTIHNLVFPVFGLYYFDIVIDGVSFQRAPFRLRAVAAPEQDGVLE